MKSKKEIVLATAATLGLTALWILRAYWLAQDAKNRVLWRELDSLEKINS